MQVVFFEHCEVVSVLEKNSSSYFLTAFHVLEKIDPFY
jgi:hypothetical protein